MQYLLIFRSKAFSPYIQLTKRFVGNIERRNAYDNFEAVKTTVAPRMAAEHFGLSVSRNGMVCCPFHDDRHPSMKDNRVEAKREADNVLLFLRSEGYIRLKADSAIPSAALYGIYCTWCSDNAYKPRSARTVSMTLKSTPMSSAWSMTTTSRMPSASGSTASGASRRWSRRRLYELRHEILHPIHPKHPPKPRMDGMDGIDVSSLPVKEAVAADLAALKRKGYLQDR